MQSTDGNKPVGSSTRPYRAMVVLFGIAAGAGIAGYAIAAWLGARQTVGTLSTPHKITSQSEIILGDGILGPRDMVW
ncbi:MAG TPA: hypothetical protein VFS58_05675, partial [Steroidobacteraceae bacterium]|nr:hypothetical protein [Steroidobacteraceae bacterium]